MVVFSAVSTVFPGEAGKTAKKTVIFTYFFSHQTFAQNRITREMICRFFKIPYTYRRHLDRGADNTHGAEYVGFFKISFLIRMYNATDAPLPAGQGPPLRARPGRLPAVRDRDAQVHVRPAADDHQYGQLDRADAGPAAVPVRGAVRHRRLERRQSDRDGRDVRHQVGPLGGDPGVGPARAAGVPPNGRLGPLHIRDRRL